VNIAQNMSMSCTISLYSKLSSKTYLNKPMITVFEVLRAINQAGGGSLLALVTNEKAGRIVGRAGGALGSADIRHPIRL
jgi:hypothetical protein